MNRFRNILLFLCDVTIEAGGHVCLFPMRQHKNKFSIFPMEIWREEYSYEPKRRSEIERMGAFHT